MYVFYINIELYFRDIFCITNRLFIVSFPVKRNVQIRIQLVACVCVCKISILCVPNHIIKTDCASANTLITRWRRLAYSRFLINFPCRPTLMCSLYVDKVANCVPLNSNCMYKFTHICQLVYV